MKDKKIISHASLCQLLFVAWSCCPSSLRLLCCLVLFCAFPSLLASTTDFRDHTYTVISGTFTWHEAKADAERRGGHLATITSQQEFDHVSSLGVLPNAPYWLGATDESDEGVWQWVTGEAWEFTRWGAGEPNNLGNEHYLLAAAAANHTWNDWGNENSTAPYYLLEIDLCSPRPAKAAAEIVNGFLVAINITDAGCGYTNAPAVRIQGGGGTGAAAVAQVTDGKVTAIIVTNAGCCYINMPTVVIGSPPFVPTLGISVSHIKVTQKVVLGRRYILESSSDLQSWTPTGPAFTADAEVIESIFDVAQTGRFFRVREVP